MRLISAAAPSKEGRKSGKTKPPSWSAAKLTPPESAASISLDDERAVVRTSAPRAAHSSPAFWLTVSGRATRTGLAGRLGPPLDRLEPVGRPAGRDQFEEHHEGLVVAQHVPGAVDQREVLPSGVDHRAEVGARAPHRPDHPGRARGRVDRNHPGRLRIRD